MHSASAAKTSDPGEIVAWTHVRPLGTQLEGVAAGKGSVEAL